MVMVGGARATGEDMQDDMDIVQTDDILTDAQKAAVLERVRKGIAYLQRPVPMTVFGKAARWVLRVYAFTVLANGPSMPTKGFGATFEDLAAYITRRDKERELEEVTEDE